MFEDIKGVLDASTEMANNLKRESAKIMIFSKIALIEQEIEDLCILRYNCQECFTEHSSQDQRMSQGGCIDNISWNEQVIGYFDQARRGVHENKRVFVANAVVKKMGQHGLNLEDSVDNSMENVS